MVQFEARVMPVKGGGHYVVVPVDAAQAAALEYGDRVRGTLDGTPYRSSLMKYSGVFHLGVHKATLAAAGARAGSMVRVTLEKDREPLPGDVLPPELKKAFARDAAARRAWEALAPSRRREQVKHIDGAKKPETRAARLEKLLASLK
jgi:hypothetical protein